QALRPGCEELAARIRKATARRCRTAGVQGDGSAAPGAQNRHGGAPRGERPASWDARRLARRLACRVISAFTRVFDARWQAYRVFRRAPERFSALRPPRDSGERSQGARPGRKTAPREREWLFDIVRWELPKTVGRRAATAVVLILRSAHAEEVPRIRARRARVSKDEDGHALMLRDAPQRTWAVEAPALGFCWEAPQDEGERRGILAKRTQRSCWPNEAKREHARERRTNLRLHEMSAGVVSLFPACYLQ